MQSFMNLFKLLYSVVARIAGSGSLHTYCLYDLFLWSPFSWQTGIELIVTTIMQCLRRLQTLNVSQALTSKTSTLAPTDSPATTGLQPAAHAIHSPRLIHT